MKVGIVADIHEHVGHLRAALRVFQQSQVDRIVVLGDVFETGEHIQETIDLLREAQAVGVWGNHDLGLCHDPDQKISKRYGAAIGNFFASLTPHFELAGLLFSHGLPIWDATDPSIFYLGERPWDPNSLTPVFSTFPQRVFLIGHFHRWFLATAGGPVQWGGEQPIFLAPGQRYFLCVHAVMNGWCAVLDTETHEFTPTFIG